MSAAQPQPKKLIEVALPLDEINAASKADKARKSGTLRNLHKWFAPMPLPAWRALLFASLVDDPDDDERRAYLLDVVKRLVKNRADLPDVDTLTEAHSILKRQFPDGVPTVMDPFCGGGSTLVEAQRLGLPTYGSDLNPIPVLITRTLTQVLPPMHGKQPLHPEDVTSRGTGRRKPTNDTALIERASLPARVYAGYGGLIQDAVVYAERISSRTASMLAPIYPTHPDEKNVAWLWARTVRCPNPACGVESVLTTSWWLSKRKDDLAWIQPSLMQGRLSLKSFQDVAWAVLLTRRS